jgi:hypothetical protein
MCLRNVRCWGYDVQDVYQRTHPVLFSDRAVYLLVFNMRAGLHSIDLRAQVSQGVRGRLYGGKGYLLGHMDDGGG